MAPAAVLTSAAAATSFKDALQPCALGSALGLTHRAGELVAVTPPRPRASYKAALKFTAITSNQHFTGQVSSVVASVNGPKKRLTPYAPDAPRSRPATLRNVPSRRYGVLPSAGGERYKGEGAAVAAAIRGGDGFGGGVGGGGGRRVGLGVGMFGRGSGSGARGDGSGEWVTSYQAFIGHRPAATRGGASRVPTGVDSNAGICSAFTLREHRRQQGGGGGGGAW